MKPLSPELVRMLSPRPRRNIAPDIWDGDAVDPDPIRRGIIRPMDADARVYSAAVEIPHQMTTQDAEGNTPISINAGCPPWHCPPLWSVPVDFPVLRCIPWYMVDTLMGTLEVPKGYLLVIKSVSYEAANAVQDDVLSFQVSVNGQPAARWEDMIADAAQVNPAHRMALCGHTRELPLHIVVPVNSAVTVSAMLMGAIDFNGVSPNWPGQPILTPDCHVKMIFNGWYFPAMNNVEGAIRQASMGDIDNRLLDGGA